MGDPQPWLMLVSSVSGENKTARMRIWRALKSSGAGTLRDGVYLLPKSERAHAVFSQQAEAVVAAGGTAHIISIATDGAPQQSDFIGLFDRTREYTDLMSRMTGLKAARWGVDEAEARRQMAAVRRDVAAVGLIDFFPGAARRQVESALIDVEAALNARFSPGEPHAAGGSIPKRKKPQYQGRTWATRQGLWIDRVASAWLIRRFIDSKAKFRWLKKPRDCPKTVVGFDFDGAEFTHVGARVTFEVLATSFDLDGDPALVRIGALVHYLDVGGIAVAEAAGFAAIMAGMRARQSGDDELLCSMSGVLDALYTSYGGRS
jgi:hypothetical protein